MSVILSAMMADSGLSFDHPGPSNGVVPIFNIKSHFFKQTLPLSHIMRLTPMEFHGWQTQISEFQWFSLMK